MQRNCNFIDKIAERSSFERNIDKIIVFFHAIFRDIALRGGPYIDIIVGGHSHTLLYNDDVPENSGWISQGPYPVVVEQPTRKVSSKQDIQIM